MHDDKHPENGLSDVLLAVSNLSQWQETPPANVDKALQAIETALQIRAALQKVFVPIINSSLDVLAGEKLGSLEENQQLVRDLNAVREAFNLCFKMKSQNDEEAVPVYLKCNRVPAAKTGNFQVVSTESYRKTLHARTQFPHLETSPNE